MISKTRRKVFEREDLVCSLDDQCQRACRGHQLSTSASKLKSNRYNQESGSNNRIGTSAPYSSNVVLMFVLVYIVPRIDGLSQRHMSESGLLQFRTECAGAGSKGDSHLYIDQAYWTWEHWSFESALLYTLREKANKTQNVPFKSEVWHRAAQQDLGPFPEICEQQKNSESDNSKAELESARNSIDFEDHLQNKLFIVEQSDKLSTYCKQLQAEHQRNVTMKECFFSYRKKFAKFREIPEFDD